MWKCFVYSLFRTVFYFLQESTEKSYLFLVRWMTVKITTATSSTVNTGKWRGIQALTSSHCPNFGDHSVWFEFSRDLFIHPWNPNWWTETSVNSDELQILSSGRGNNYRIYILNISDNVHSYSLLVTVLGINVYGIFAWAVAFQKPVTNVLKNKRDFVSAMITSRFTV